MTNEEIESRLERLENAVHHLFKYQQSVARSYIEHFQYHPDTPLPVVQALRETLLVIENLETPDQD